MHHPISILIVEDEMSIALELEMLIDELGYQLNSIIDNGEEVLTIATEKLPDLILMDIGIKGKYSGLEVAEKIKHLPIAVLFITSYQNQEMFQRAKLTNFAGYVTKPVSKVALQGAIEMATRFYSNQDSDFFKNYKQSNNIPTYEKEDVFITRFKRYVLNNLSDSNLQAGDIAEKMGMSRMQLHRKLKALTTYSTGKYIQAIRLEKALELLREQKWNVTEVAYQVGFRNPNHFSRLFKNKFGQSPSHILKK